MFIHLDDQMLRLKQVPLLKPHLLIDNKYYDINEQISIGHTNVVGPYNFIDTFRVFLTDYKNEVI